MIKEHFLQSKEWMKFQKSLGNKTFFRKGEGWRYRAIFQPKSGMIPARIYCPYGPTVKNDHALKNALASLVALAKSQDAAFIRIEPLGFDFEPEKHHLSEVNFSQPAYTWCVDLTQEKDEIIANMKQNNRSIYRNYHKKDMTYEESTNPDDIEYLCSLLKGVASHNQINVHSEEYLKRQTEVLMKQNVAKLHFIKLKDEIIASALTYRCNGTVYYAHAAADYEHRRLAASTALLGEIITRAKDEGFESCDLYGITTDDNPNEKWKGFTKFKKSFGGYEKKLSKTYDLPVKKSIYFIYKNLKTIKEKLKK